MASSVSGLTRGTLRSAPSVCQGCVWWQSRGHKIASKERWIDRVEDEWGEWGTLYLDDDGRFLGVMQYGPADLFPRAVDLPAGPPSDDAALVTCAFLAADAGDWVEKSLLLAAIGECRDRGARALEAFAYRFDEEADEQERFRTHRTVFPRDFLDDFGFRTLRARGRVELCRLDLGGLAPVEEGARARVLRVVQEAFTPPAPAPVPRP
jgi:GNAT superfamily N-acetyltransferase